MTPQNRLQVRLEMAEQTLRGVAVEAESQNLPDIVKRVVKLKTEVQTLILLTNPILRCECDPDTCTGCIDYCCFN